MILKPRVLKKQLIVTLLEKFVRIDQYPDVVVLSESDVVALDSLVSLSSMDELREACYRLTGIRWYFDKSSPSSSDRYLDGFSFFEACFEYVDEGLSDEFLELTWLMFDTFRAYTDWHPWRGQFDPLHEVDPGDKYAQLFRSGVIKFELARNSFGSVFDYTYRFRWWTDFLQFLYELNDSLQVQCILDEVGEVAGIDEIRNLNSELGKAQLISIYRSLPEEKIDYINSLLKSNDWDDIKSFE